MAAVLAAARYYRGGFSLCLAGSARCVMVPGGSMFHLEPGTIMYQVLPHTYLWSFDGGPGDKLIYKYGC